MKKFMVIAVCFFVLAVGSGAVLWTQYSSAESSIESSDLEDDREEMQQMDHQMEAQPEDGINMDVQPNDAIDSEGMGAH